jgi:hypothetical protein
MAALFIYGFWFFLEKKKALGPIILSKAKYSAGLYHRTGRAAGILSTVQAEREL